MESADEISILIATDNHLGYMEKDPIRGKDSMTTFEEILSIAKDRQVDFILLGGDLYHDNKPSRRTTYESMALFREYCWGDKPIQLEICSDQSVNFQDRFSTVNYNDKNINVSIPVFSIHGNHDDPTGDGRYCALDLLSVSGFVNYYGKCTDVDNITLSPILLKKNNTKLALYGLGNIRDERLHRTFRRRNVKVLRPEVDTADWFNLMVIHQNRVAHGPKNYIPETFLDDFLHFVLWGHEHECLIEPAQNPQQGFYVTQPGSSIATSLSDGESRQKHVGILTIRGTSHKLEKIRLKTVRPFIMRETVLATDLGTDKASDKEVGAHLRRIVYEMIKEAADDFKALNPEVEEAKIPRPLIRLRQFGREFVSLVANPKDIILFYRKKRYVNKEDAPNKVFAVVPQHLPSQLDNIRVEDLVQEYLDAQSLSILPENQLSQAVGIFVDKDDKDAIKEFVRCSIDKTRTMLGELEINDKNDIQKEAENVKILLSKEFSSIGKPLVVNTKKNSKKDTKKTAVGKNSRNIAFEDEDEEDDEAVEDDEPIVTVKTTAKKRGKAAAKRGSFSSGEDENPSHQIPPPKKTTGKKKTLKSSVPVSEDDENDEFIKPTLKTTSTSLFKNSTMDLDDNSMIPSSSSNYRAEDSEPIFAKPSARKLPFGKSRKRTIEEDGEEPVVAKKKPAPKKKPAVAAAKKGGNLKQSTISFQTKKVDLGGADEEDETFQQFSERT